MKKKKDVGVVINFDDKEYSKEETIFLYQRFYEILAEAKDMKVPQNFGKILYDCISKGNKDR